MEANKDHEARQIFEAIRILLGNDQNLMNYIFKREKFRLRVRAGILKEDAWKFSDSEQLLIRVALDFWSGSGHAQLWELLENWKVNDWKRFEAAVHHYDLLKLFGEAYGRCDHLFPSGKPRI